MSLPVLRVFVSSTWIDLQPERHAVEQALARLRETKFIGMEHFGSRSETTREVSLLEVNPTDLYVGIIGGRYGSGITEDEYRRALELKLHCFIYFKDEATIAPEGRDAEQEKASYLSRLKDDMRRHCATTFRSPDDLAAKVTADLHRWIFDRYLSGLTALRTDYATRIQNFLTEYLGKLKEPVPFGGRDDELSRLDAWLDDPDAVPYVLLAAPAGRGKSALLVRWTQRLLSRPDLGIAFLPVSIRFRTNLAGVVFPTVTARLVALHGEKLTADPNTSVEVWRGMMTDYLARPLPKGRRLLLVLDGLDEAADWEPGPDLFPGSPPEGLRVLLSARLRAGDADGSSWLASLGWDRPGLGRALDLARLTAAGVADVLRRMGCPLDELGRRVDLVAELHRLSEGDPLLVRLYVDDLWARGQAVVRLRPEDLRGIRPGLQGYFTRWWEDQRRLWGDQTPLRELAVQGLLNLLACALGPLGREDVLRLVPPELGLTTWTLEEALRPLVRFVLGDGERQGYVFSHPRLGGYFHERLSTRERQGTESRFLAWGEETLAGLNEERLLPLEAPPYVVQYYAAHIERARQGLEKLLALVSDGWRRAWEALEGSAAGFLNDVGRTWRAASGANEVQVNRGGLAGYLGAEVRCALCRASVQSLAGNVSPALLKAAVEQGQWTASQGLAYARQMVEPKQRLEALSALAPHLPEPLRSEVLAEALEAAQAIMYEADRSQALAALAPHLPEPLRSEVLAQALEAARAIEHEDYRSRALAALVPHLPEPLLAQALEAARAIGYGFSRSHALAALAPQLAEPLREQVLAQALEAARANDYSSAQALAALAPHLPEPLRSEVLAEALEAAQAIMYEPNRSQALAALAPHLPEPLLAQALEAARAIRDESSQVQALAALAPHLSEPLLAQALNKVQAIRDESSRVRALAALKKVRAIRDESSRVRALAPQLPEPVRGEGLAQALEAARAIRDESSRVRALAALAPQLPEPVRGEGLAQALEAARAIRDESSRAQALSALAPHLPEPLLTQALETARAIEDEFSRSQALAALAPHLPEPLLTQALEAARALRRTFSRSQALAALAPHLSEPLRSEVQAQALEAAQAIKVQDDRSQARVARASHLPEPLLTQALETARAIEDEDARSQALAALAPRLSTRPASCLFPVWEQSLPILASRTRGDLLADLRSLLPVILRLGGAQAVAEIFRAIRDVGRWWP